MRSSVRASHAAGLLVAMTLFLPSLPAGAAPRPDLVITSISRAPTEVARGSEFKVVSTVKNIGGERASRSATRFYLSTDKKKSPLDVRLQPSQNVKALPGAKSSKAATKVSVPVSMPLTQNPPVFYLIACADDTKQVRESKERNNCRTSSSRVLILPGPTSAELIEADLAAGKITPEQALVFEVFAAFDDERLPAKYRGADAELLDSFALVHGAAAFDDLPPAAKAPLIPFLRAPAYPDTWEELDTATRRTASTALPERMKRKVDMTAEDPPPKHPSPLGEEGWFFYEHLRARIWFREDRASEITAGIIFANLEEVWTDLTSLMGVSPMSDAGPHPFTDENGQPQTWGDGGNGLLDIYVAQLPRGTQGVTSTYPPGCKARPSFIVIDDFGSGGEALVKEVRGTLAHEFMHVIQLTYLRTGDCASYDSWDESVAQWAIDYVFPDDQIEHQTLKFLFRNDWHGGLGRAEYDGWIFPLYLEHTMGPQKIPEIYDASEVLSAWDAIDGVLSGGFEKRWPEFLRLAWNQLPVGSHFLDWDNIANTPALETKPKVKPIKAGEDYELPVGLGPLDQGYYSFSFPDGNARYIEFRNGLVGVEGASVQAMIRLRDDSWREEDWTDEGKATFCRNEEAEDIVELVVVIGNSNFLPNGRDIESTSTEVNAGRRCPSNFPDGFTGTFSGSDPIADFSPSWTGNANFVLDDIRSGGADYKLNGGSFTWTTQSHTDEEGCIHTPDSGVSFSLDGLGDSIFVGDGDPPTAYGIDINETFSIVVTVTCPDPNDNYEYEQVYVTALLDTPGQPLPQTKPGYVLTGDWADRGMTWQWSFSPS